MLRTRVIPCLLLHQEGLVKTHKFSSPKYVGDPINAIKIFNDKEVDELIVLDIGASKGRVGPNFTLIEQFASECFMPLCYGGGVRSLEDAKKLFSLGVEKICLQTSALEDITLVKKIAEHFGSQSVVVSVDVKSHWIFGDRLYHAAKRKSLKEPWLEFLQNSVEMGAGEIVINSVDHEGTMTGVNLNLIEQACDAVPVPVIAMGGVGSLQDIKNASDAGASAVAAGAFFVFQGPHRAILITFPEYRVLEDLLREK